MLVFVADQSLSVEEPIHIECGNKFGNVLVAVRQITYNQIINLINLQ